MVMQRAGLRRNGRRLRRLQLREPRPLLTTVLAADKGVNEKQVKFRTAGCTTSTSGEGS